MIIFVMVLSFSNTIKQKQKMKPIPLLQSLCQSFHCIPNQKQHLNSLSFYNINSCISLKSLLAFLWLQRISPILKIKKQYSLLAGKGGTVGEEGVGRSNRKKQNINSLNPCSMRPYRRECEQQCAPLTIGYYPFRGKAQICRLLCEYLHVPYVDLFFTPDQWNKFKEAEARDWIVRDLPFLRDNDFVVTGPTGMISYLIERAGRTDLFGRTLADRVKIDSIKSKHDLSGAVLGLICSARPSLSHQEKKSLSFYWVSKIEPILRDYEHECPEEGWYYGYLTVMDFVIYELLNLLSSVFNEQVGKYVRLMALRHRLSSIPEIRNYENSSRALGQHCPVRYFSKFKEERTRNTHRPNVVLKEATQMDIQ